MKINQIIREKRKELSLTQEQVAARLGVSVPAVSKWEQGVTYPDVTLLPGLARLLKTDLNTLLSFQDDLSSTEISQFVDEVDKTVRGKNYEAGFQMAMAKMQEFPTCESLIISTVMYLEGALLLFGSQKLSQSEQERYKKIFEGFYERLSGSMDPQIRGDAVTMLISRSRERNDFARARELIGALPASSIDTEEQQAVLFTQEGNYQEAEKLWEHRVLNGVTEIQTALIHMMEIAVKEDRPEDAHFYADRYEQISKLFYVTQWIPYNAKLQLSVLEQDKTACLQTLRAMFSAMEETWKPQTSPLYRHLEGGETNIFSEWVSSSIREDLEKGEEFSFLRDCPEYQELLRELQGDRKQKA